jgi:putative 4-mercaptohistidine N1-methyltranferase
MENKQNWAGEIFMICDRGEKQVKNPYETGPLESQYCEFHYGAGYFNVGNFPAYCARLCLEHMGTRTRGHALDVGCSVGRTTFELAREFSHVTGVDFSERFIHVADDLRETGRISYSVPVEGDIVEQVERSLDLLGLDHVRPRVEFLRADAMALPLELTGYDLIFAGNLIDRLREPRLFLGTLPERLNPGGLLVITSPYTWLDEFTPRENWLGGFTVDGIDSYTLEGMKRVLDPDFRLAAEPLDVPFVIRETARKFQHSIAEMTVWERR